MLQVENLHKVFGGVSAVNGANFKVENGINAIIGPNGAGKTTLFNLITGYQMPDSGCIRFHDSDISRLEPDAIARLGISRTFQLIRLFPKMTVMENMLLAMPDHPESLIQSLIMPPSLKKKEKELQVRAHEMLSFVGLDIKVNQLAENLSYGQQKLLEIAKALASKPKILMLDEPAAGVNPTMLNKIRDLLIELKNEGKTILFIEHNMEFVMNLADQIIVLDYGKEIACGSPKIIKNNKQVINAYLGSQDHSENVSVSKGLQNSDRILGDQDA
jgi:branched-chain amino acid transport system ATP-binding protein